MAKGNRDFTDDYKRICFEAWCLNGRPTMDKLQELIPVSDNGNKPGLQALRNWRNDDSWDFKADEVDAQVNDRNLDLLVHKKSELLKVQLEQVTMVATSAYYALVSGTYDTTSSAVQAFYRGMEEQRKIAGFSDLLEKLESMTNNQVRDEIIALINRATDNNQIVEGNATGIAGEIEENTDE